MKIGEVEKLSGVSQGALRLWESRHGWPHPRRSRNGSRIYTQNDVELIKRVNILLKNGGSLREIIVDGYPVLPSLIKTQKILKVERPIFSHGNSNDIAKELEKSAYPLKCVNSLIVLTIKSDREKLLKYAEDLNNQKQ
jgi:DNA-binding transcriptional MerR regulator